MPSQLARALQATTSAEILACLRPRRPTLTLPEIQRLTQHLDTLQSPRTSLRLAVLHTYTSELLDPYLRFEALLQGFEAAVYHGPYGTVVQQADRESGLVAHQPDLTLLLLRWQDLAPALDGSLQTLTPEERESLGYAVRVRLLEHLQALRHAVGGHLLLTLLPALHGPSLGDYGVNVDGSDEAWRDRTKRELAADLRQRVAAASLLDLEESVAAVGRQQFFDHRWWYSARFPFSPVGAQDLARRVVTAAAALKRPPAKVIVLDADNTLWGGVLGEDGLDGIALGPEYPGNVYVAFQRRLLDYRQRGFLLALCSKNNEADVREALRLHPHQLLREGDFAAMRVNWNPKPENLESLARELRLGLDSFVVVDDSAHECLAIRQHLPEVEVVQLPDRVLDIPTSLDDVPRLEILTLTDEDRARAEMYAQDRSRQARAAAATDPSEYLRSLQMEMSVAFDDPRHSARVAQLTQKTNQFNVTTRRYTEADIVRLMGTPDCLVADFALRDVFGDSGIVGVAIARVTSRGEAELDSFLMSCRVIGRRAESAFLEAVLDALRHRGVRTVLADYIPTAKNGLVATFLAEHGFAPRHDGRHARSLEGPTPVAAIGMPITVRVSGEALAHSALLP